MYAQVPTVRSSGKGMNARRVEVDEEKTKARAESQGMRTSRRTVERGEPAQKAHASTTRAPTLPR